MAKPNTRGSNPEAFAKTVRGETVNYPAMFEQIQSTIDMEQGVIVTTLPRGGLQIAQPQDIPEPLLRAYVREFHASDRPSWTAIANRQPARAMDCWSTAEYPDTPYFKDFLVPNGLAYAAAAPLKSPVLDGYPGALTLFRTQQQGRFSESELTRLGQIARQVDETIQRARANRKPSPGTACPAVKNKIPMRQFVFDSHLKPRIGQDDLSKLDDRLRQQMIQQARQRFEHVNGKDITADRVPLPDSYGDLWNFRVVVHRTYPALGEGPFVFFCLQPDCGEWSLVRPQDFHADTEVSRLIPAMRFMEENFAKGPTLTDIARTVHLSPFHFHRRFTELLGVTPKHFMLDCQIAKAKRDLLAREKDLAQIATECGFAHQSHFTSRFKQATGLTPTRWRRLATEMQRAGESN